MNWLARGNPIRRERHFSDRVVGCYQNRPRSICAMFDAACAAHPNNEAIVDGTRRLSYVDLDGAHRRFAAALAAGGINAGDRVVINIGNGAEFIIMLLGILRIGAIAVAAGTRMRRPELQFMYENCSASAVIFGAETAPEQPAASHMPSARVWISHGGSDVNDAQDFDAMLQAASPLPGAPEVAEDDCALLLYTSGTTGQPKGAMLSHLGVIHSCLHWLYRFDLKVGERTILSVPASHVTGLVAQILPMFAVAGCTITMAHFDVDDFLSLAEAEGLSYSIMVPAMYNLILLRGSMVGRDLSKWRIGAFGGAPMPVATISGMAAALPGLYLANAYGATEVASPATIMPLDACRGRPGSIGKAVDCGDIRIMDDAGIEVAPGEVGEIWISGPNVIGSYWDRPDANATSFVGGYWLSGDIGSMDGDGFVTILDRKKDMINRGGYKIFSAEVENVLGGHERIVEAALVPVKCVVLGERAHAFITVDEAGLLEPDDVRKFLADKVADYKVPDFYTIETAPLPRNANGKLQKQILRARLG